jgi:hypothetical protein
MMQLLGRAANTRQPQTSTETGHVAMESSVVSGQMAVDANHAPTEKAGDETQRTEVNFGIGAEEIEQAIHHRAPAFASESL